MEDHELLVEIHSMLSELSSFLTPLKGMVAGLTGPKMAMMPKGAANAARQMQEMQRKAMEGK